MRNFIIYLAAVTLYSCQDQYSICDMPRTVNLNAGFYQVTAGTESIAYADTFSIALLNSSAPIISATPHISKFSIPLNPTVDSTLYLIRISNSWPLDTLTVVYSTQNVNISAECGNVNINSVIRTYSTWHSIDSVKIANPAVDPAAAENLKIYF